MSTAMHDVARSALPVALILFTLAAAARASLTRTADQYLEPLCTWCLGAVGLYAVTAGLAGDITTVALVVVFALGTGAVLLRPAADPPTPVADAPPPPPVAPPVPPAAPARASLWAEPLDDPAHAPRGLWSRG